MKVGIVRLKEKNKRETGNFGEGPNAESDMQINYSTATEAERTI